MSVLLKKYLKASSILISFLVSLTDMETKDLYLSIGPTGKQTIALLVLFIRLLAEAITQLEREKRKLVLIFFKC